MLHPPYDSIAFCACGLLSGRSARIARFRVVYPLIDDDIAVVTRAAQFQEEKL
jgi:hypothetical protein